MSTGANEPSSRGAPASVAAVTAAQAERDRLQRIVDTSVADHAREVAQLRRALEREKQQWLQDQQLEQTQWKRRLEAAERTRMRELEDEWARREEERTALVRSTQAEYERLEQTLRTSLLELDARERRLAVAEHALQREQQTLKDETEVTRKRLQSEHAHGLALAHKQVEAHEKRVRVLETQLRDAEERARQVESDFAEYRLQQRKVPEARLREEIASLKGALLALEKQKMEQEKLCDAAETRAAGLTQQLEHMARVVQTERKKNESRVVDELEKLRVKYVAREEKYVLDGDREELRAIKRQLDELKGLDVRHERLGAGRRDARADVATVASTRPLAKQQRRQRVVEEQRVAVGARQGSQRRRQLVQPLQVIHTAPRRGVRSHGASSRSSWSSSQRSLADERHAARHDAQSDGDSSSDHALDESDASHHDSSEYYEHDDDESDDDRAFEDDAHHVENDSDAGNTHAAELERLEHERTLLLASGAYTTESYLVREISRLIDAARGHDGDSSSRTRRTHAGL